MMVMIVLIDRSFANDYPKRIELSVDIARARSVAAAPWAVFLGRRTLRETAQQRSSGRRRELTRAGRTMSNVESLEKAYRRRRWNGQHSVRGFHRAIAQRDFRIVDALDSQQLDSPDRSDDVENRIDRSDLVEMELVRR